MQEFGSAQKGFEPGRGGEGRDAVPTMFSHAFRGKPDWVAALVPLTKAPGNPGPNRVGMFHACRGGQKEEWGGWRRGGNRGILTCWRAFEAIRNSHRCGMTPDIETSCAR